MFSFDTSLRAGKLCRELVMKPVAATRPVITSNATTSTNFCNLQEGQRVTLTCKVKYNGTNLMPMVLQWYDTSHIDSGAVYMVNMSSIFESSLTVTATVSGRYYNYKCTATFSSPTGIVIQGVQRQYENKPLSLGSNTIYPFWRVASAF